MPTQVKTAAKSLQEASPSQEVSAPRHSETVEETQSAGDSENGHSEGRGDTGSVSDPLVSRGRDWMRSFTDGKRPELEEFFTSALAVTKTTWFTCRHCQRKTEVAVADWNARNSVVRTMLENGYGKPSQAPEQPSRSGAGDLDKLTDSELQALL